MQLEDPLFSQLAPAQLVSAQFARTTLVLCCALVLGSVGCAGTAWQRTLEADSASAYHQFLRDYPDSPYVAEAKERLIEAGVTVRPPA